MYYGWHDAVGRHVVDDGERLIDKVLVEVELLEERIGPRVGGEGWR